LSASALVELVEHSQATALLTYADDLAERYDRRVEPVVQHAAGIFRLSHEAGQRRMQVISLRELSTPLASTMSHFTPAEVAPREPLIDTAAHLVLLHLS